MSLITATIRRKCNPPVHNLRPVNVPHHRDNPTIMESQITPVDDQLATGQCPSSPRQSDDNVVHRSTMCDPPMSFITETIRRKTLPISDPSTTSWRPVHECHRRDNPTICNPKLNQLTTSWRPANVPHHQDNPTRMQSTGPQCATRQMPSSPTQSAQHAVHRSTSTESAI